MLEKYFQRTLKVLFVHFHGIGFGVHVCNSSNHIYGVGL